jgi:N-dimethylarginine dimethylaminohydrolase
MANHLTIAPTAQVYEKKAKKKDRDAAAEHTRYVDLLSTLGADMAQAKS